MPRTFREGGGGGGRLVWVQSARRTMRSRRVKGMGLWWDVLGQKRLTAGARSGMTATEQHGSLRGICVIRAWGCTTCNKSRNEAKVHTRIPGYAAHA